MYGRAPLLLTWNYHNIVNRLYSNMKLKVEKTKGLGTSLMVQCLTPCHPMKGMWARSLLEELRSHMPQGQETQNRRNTVTNSIKTLKIQLGLKKKKSSWRSKLELYFTFIWKDTTSNWWSYLSEQLNAVKWYWQRKQCLHQNAKLWYCFLGRPFLGQWFVILQGS